MCYPSRVGRQRTVICHGCGRHLDEVGPLSQRKLCEECSLARMHEHAMQLHERRGPAWSAWLEGMAASVVRIIEREAANDSDRPVE